LGEGADWWVEQRYRAVLEVRDGSPVSEVAERYGVSRQAVYGWRDRFDEAGVAALADRSRRPHRSPTRTSGEVEAEICELRRRHPRWGARRIAYELARTQHGEAAPSRATVHRVLLRHGLVASQEQRRPRRYKRWARETPMALWQLDIVGGVFLADGREVKMVSGIDDHSRYVVIAALVVVPTGRAVSEALLDAVERYGVPGEVLTDNGKQFTGRYTRPAPVEVLFERVCREHGITARLTKRRSPTTTGKIERFHQTLRRELLDQVAPFADLDTAQAAIEAWVHGYNHSRPHQSLDMAVPADLFRPGQPPRADRSESAAGSGRRNADEVPVASSCEDAEPASSVSPSSSVSSSVSATPAGQIGAAGAVELEVRVPGCGSVALAAHQQLWLGPAYGGRVVTVWADVDTVHVSLEGQLLKTVPSRLSSSHLGELRARGARPAGAPPAAAALPRSARHAAPDTVVEVDRVVGRDGLVRVDNTGFNVGSPTPAPWSRCASTATSSTPSPGGCCWAAGPTRSPSSSVSPCAVPVVPAGRCPRRPRRRHRGRSVSSAPTGSSWSPASACGSGALTPARPSPSSPRTPASASSTATVSSPPTPATPPSR
jgi:transposase InsO family protein